MKVVNYLGDLLIMLNRISEHYEMTRSKFLTLRGVKINCLYCPHFLLKNKILQSKLNQIF